MIFSPNQRIHVIFSSLYLYDNSVQFAVSLPHSLNEIERTHKKM